MYEVEQEWPFVGLDETVQILNVCITPKTPDVFGQIAYAEITIKAPFHYIDDPNLKTLSMKPTTFPLLRELAAVNFRISQHEYVQQH